MAERDELGLHALQLLAEDWMIAVLGGLADGAIRPAELERGLPHAAHSVVLRRLRRLLEDEVVSCEHQPGIPPHPGSVPSPRRAYYSLTDAGRKLLEVAAEADRWEQTWCSGLERGTPPGILAIGLCSNQRTREIMLALADGPLAARDLRARLPESRSSTLRRRLSNLVLGGLLEQDELEHVRRYALTTRARQLAGVAMLAGRWEWRWSRPAHTEPGRDLHDLVRVLAPLARIDEQIAGVCQLHLAVGGGDDLDLHLAAQDGEVHVPPGVPSTPPQAIARGNPEALCNALLEPREQITTTGDQALMDAVIAALHTALVAKPPQTPPHRSL